ncbi:methyltransferase family protein [Anaerobacterium chartisolvens]|uniref:Methyltransferase family protein n=2 Tax=Anaerobacterium chartisolvens TaxID=1297424 RepID=A0A369BGI7_9FIRM|nr:methyltransferase family protein [Anaerobacterium chartisolvens]
MGFYEQISRYYDYIFPAGREQLDFIRECAGVPPKKVVDVACGSGGYAIELAKLGYDVTAVDIDEKMIEKTKSKASQERVDIRAFKCDMRNLSGTVTGENDCVYCIGNSIVHLAGKKEISDVLGQMHSVLGNDGTLIIQIINYDRIIRLDVQGLPDITNREAGLKFIRRYKYCRDTGLIDFNTVLEVANGSEVQSYENIVPLFPLMSRDMAEMLEREGFKDISLYGDFTGTPYNENSFMLVVKAVK